jgi:hypothetical protein
MPGDGIGYGEPKGFFLAGSYPACTLSVGAANGKGRVKATSQLQPWSAQRGDRSFLYMQIKLT